MYRLLAVLGLLFASTLAHAGGVAVCGDKSKAGQGLMTCLSALSYQPTPAQDSLFLTCQSASVQPGRQDMNMCPVTVWKTLPNIVASELVGYCDQAQLSPYNVCDYPNGAEGYKYARDVLGVGGGSTTTGPAVISWQKPALNVDGQASSVTGYRIEYGQTDFTQSVTTTATTYTFTLAAGTWQFRVVALSASGESIPTNPVTTTVFAGSSPPAPTVAFSASPTTITAGSSTSLSWSSVNATACSGVGTGTSGMVSVSPQSTTSYTQTCSGAGGTASASAVVTVTAAQQTGNWYVAPSGTSTTRTVYEAVLPQSGTTLVRGNADGRINVGKTCGAQVFTEGTTSYRSVANSDVQLNSPTYASRSHVAVCEFR